MFKHARLHYEKTADFWTCYRVACVRYSGQTGTIASIFRVTIFCSVVLENDSTGAYVRALRGCLRNDLQMVLCVVPSNRKDRYDAIKTLCCVDHGGRYSQ
jgi:hypothetical protein